MTAMDGGERLDEDTAALTPVLERRSAGAPPRPLEEIFPLRGDADRARLMLETWQAFAVEMAGAVRAALAASRSPPQIAYAVGEVVHNFFRTRGLTLTSYELRRLVVDLLAAQAGGGRPHVAPLVRFASEPSGRNPPWTGAEPGAPPTAIADAAFRGPPSALVTVAPRDSNPDLLSLVIGKVRARLGGDPCAVPRGVVVDAIAAVLDGAEVQAQQRRRLTRQALSELCGLGPIDRLWADRSIGAVLVNGPSAVHVERAGIVEPAPERFRDLAHLEEIARRLAGRTTSPAVTVHLRDGGEAVVLLPPAAPRGPVLALRRGQPGGATLERLVGGGKLSRSMADLLRIATRSRLAILVVGPEGSGKTALLAAIARDVEGARSVTLARHRAFCSADAARIELVVSPEAPFATMLAAAMRLRPDLLVVDPVLPSDTGPLAELVAHGSGCGIVAAGKAKAMAAIPRDRVDLRVSVAPRDGSFVVVSMEDATGAPLFTMHEQGGFGRHPTMPSFAGAVRAAGYGDALTSVLR